MISFWHHTVICVSVCLSACLSVTLCIVANLNDTPYSKKCPNKYVRSLLGTRFYNFQPPISSIDPIPSSTPLLQRWCHLANTLKTHCEQPDCQNFHVWNSHRHRMTEKQINQPLTFRAYNYKNIL